MNSFMQNQTNALKMRELINKKQEQIKKDNVTMRPGYYTDQLKSTNNRWRTLNNYWTHKFHLIYYYFHSWITPLNYNNKQLKSWN